MSSYRSSRLGMFASIAAILSLCCALVFSPSAHAHDAVIYSSPADEAIVDGFPEQIELEFSGVPQEGFNTIALSNERGEVLFSGEPTIEGRRLIVSLPQDLKGEPGDYTVGYQITSSDGHATRGKITFSVRANDAPTTSTVEPSITPTPVAEEGADNSTLFIIGAFVLILILSSGALLLIRRR